MNTHAERNIDLARKLAHKWSTKTEITLEDALGICQEGLFRASQKYDPRRGAFTTLAYAVIGNAIKAYLRRQQKQPDAVSLADETQDADSDCVDWIADDADTEATVIRRIEASRIKQAISNLNEKQAVAVTLYYGIDCKPHTYAEIGEFVGVTKAAICYRIKRAHEQLQKTLDGVV